MLKRLVLSVALAAWSPAWAGQVLDRIKTEGVLRVGTTGDYKPFTFREADNRYHGADIEMAKRLAATIGVRLELVETAYWLQRDDDLLTIVNGVIDEAKRSGAWEALLDQAQHQR